MVEKKKRRASEGRSLAADRRQAAKNVVSAGHGDQGDQRRAKKKS